MTSDPARADLSPEDERALDAALVRLNSHAWGVACALIGGGGLFAATALLLIRGGETIGPHLALLGIYLPGYHVTWAGAVIGLGYGLLLGYAVGWAVGAIYNRLVVPR